MSYLLLSILSSVGIFWAFRLFRSYEVFTRHGIMINYLVAAVCGLIVFRPDQLWFHTTWFIPSCFLGVLFYVVFRIMARVTQENGISTSSIATKMSVVIPVLFGLTILQESIAWMKGLGILLGIIAIILSAGEHQKQGTWLWPVLLFLGSGVVDASLKLFQHYWVSDDAFPYLISNIFFFAFFSALVHHVFTSNRRVAGKAWLGGLGLGIVNFAALYFLLKSLALPNWESSLVFPLNNFGIILGSTLLAVIGFQERLSKRGWIGVAVALASIVLLSSTI